MELSKLTAKPTLVKVTIDDEDIVKEFGEPIDFYVYDRQKMDVFMQMATIKQENYGEIATLVEKLVLDKDGKQVITKESTIPVKVMMRVIQKVVDSLGNSVSQTTKK
jgi:hypothetical protein